MTRRPRTCTHRDRHTERHTQRHTHRDTHTHTDTHTETDTHTHTETHTQRHTHTHRDRDTTHTETHTHRDRDTETHTQRHTRRLEVNSSTVRIMTFLIADSSTEINHDTVSNNTQHRESDWHSQRAHTQQHNYIEHSFMSVDRFIRSVNVSY